MQDWVGEAVPGAEEGRGQGNWGCPLQIPGFGTSQQIILATSTALIQPPG